MSVNLHKPHVIVLPEDDANRQIANGFVLDANLKPRNIQVLPAAGGWSKVLDSFVKEQIAALRKYEHRYVVLLIDFDDRVVARTHRVVKEFPNDVCDRVFLRGTWNEPESLRKHCGESLENIGKKLAAECFRDETELWQHPLLKHNQAERGRLNAAVKAILF